ncbi:MAG: hypothetical protein IJV40_03105 [Oscillospiraceae bacterium]|nr:hypothetical protein [Oscillospiraceae bacterium]
MAKMVGLNLVIKQGWMKKAVSLLPENLPEEKYRKELDEHLAYEIDSPTNRRKAREIMMRVWYLDSEGTEKLQQEGRELIQKYPDQLSAIGWCMIPLAYPMFYDQGRLMGKLFEFQESVSTATIKAKMADEYGERGVVGFSAEKIISTMRQLECVKSEKTGQQLSGNIRVVNPEIVEYMLRVVMTLDGSSYYSFPQLTEFPFLFPFEFKVTKEQLMENDNFILGIYGSALSVSLRDV